MADKTILIVGETPTEAIQLFAKELESKHHTVDLHGITEQEREAFNAECDAIAMTLHDVPFMAIEQLMRDQGETEKSVRRELSLILSGAISYALNTPIESIAFALTSSEAELGDQITVALFDIFRVTTGIIIETDPHGLQVCSGTIYLTPYQA